MQRTAHRTISRSRVWPLASAVSAAILVGLPTASEAQTCEGAACPADFIALESPQIQSSKTSFKFQSRISQAKMPVGDVKFPVVKVRLKEGAKQWCEQTLNNVQVRDSVLNIEVGPESGMDCSMPIEDLIAAKGNLGFQVCIGDDNCLKPIALSSVPYAIKSEYAVRSQESYQADVAAQAHYAHRMAADIDLLTTPTLSTGYYDFHSPLTASTVAGLSGAAVTDGFIQWTPVGTSTKKLNVSAKNEAQGTLTPLDQLALHATMTRAFGNMDVAGSTDVGGALDVNGSSEFHQHVNVDGGIDLDSGNFVVAAESTSYLYGTTWLVGPETNVINLKATNLDVANTATFHAPVTFQDGAEVMFEANPVTFSTNGFPVTFDSTTPVTFNGSVNIAGSVGSTSANLTGSTIAVSGNSSFGHTTVSNGLTVSTGSTQLQATNIAGNLVVSGRLDVGGASNNVVLGHSNNSVLAGVSNATISGGYEQIVGQSDATIGGGFSNEATAYASVIGGGHDNYAHNASYITIGGGYSNQAIGAFGATIGGGYDNDAAGSTPTIAGGQSNATSGSQATVGGGWSNSATNNFATVAGGYDNLANQENATVAGGRLNQATGLSATVAGGAQNLASNTDTTIGGGFSNVASAVSSVVAGGNDNTASGTDSSVLGGFSNEATGTGATIAGGQNNTAGNLSFAVGLNKNADGAYSVALGSEASVPSARSGCFVFSDASSTVTSCPANNMFIARVSGGARFYTDAASTTIGVGVSAGGGSWASLSDRNAKHDIRVLDGETVLKALERVPVATWRYKSEKSQAMHMGPMAQDFHAAFGLGEDDRQIVTVDADGVALGAIKGLHSLVKKQAATIEAQSAKIESLSREVSTLSKQGAPAASNGELTKLREQNAELEERLQKLERRAEPSWLGGSMFGGAGGLAAVGLALVLGRRRKAS